MSRSNGRVLQRLNLRPQFLNHQAGSAKGTEAGMTLVELLVASVITSVVVAIMFTVVNHMLRVSKIAEAQTQRRVDLSRAFDFMSNEVRMATRINHTETMSVGGGNTLQDVLNSAGITNAKLGNPGTVVLYLEIPIPGTVPALCPSGGPNAGSPPPGPATYDQVVYDIRPSSDEWLPPRSIRRYGRIPEIDGRLNPCSNPVVADTLVDAIADSSDTPPACTTPRVLTGAEGFHACVDGTEVQLVLNSHIQGVAKQSLQSRASSRVNTTTVPPVLEISRTPGSNNVTLNWSWAGDTNTQFEVYRYQDNYTTTPIYAGPALTLADTLTGVGGTKYCYTVVATTPSQHVARSNQICEVTVDPPGSKPEPIPEAA